MPANDKEAHVPIWFTLKIGGAEAAGFFKEATGFDSESEVTEIKRSMPNGKTDVIKAMGNTKWGDIELKRGVDQDKTLWNWRKLIVDGQAQGQPARTARSTMLDYEGSPVVDVLDRQRLAEEVHGRRPEGRLERGRRRGHHALPRGLRDRSRRRDAMKSEYAFTLPRGLRRRRRHRAPRGHDAPGDGARRDRAAAATSRCARTRRTSRCCCWRARSRGSGSSRRSPPSWSRACTRRTSTTSSASTSGSTPTARRWGWWRARPARSEFEVDLTEIEDGRLGE